MRQGRQGVSALEREDTGTGEARTSVMAEPRGYLVALRLKEAFSLPDFRPVTPTKRPASPWRATLPTTGALRYSQYPHVDRAKLDPLMNRIEKAKLQEEDLTE